MNSIVKSLGIILVIAIIIATSVAILFMNEDGLRVDPVQDSFELKIINLEDQFNTQPLINLAEAYAQASGEFVLNATTINVNLDQLSEQLGTLLNDTDAIIFPSEAHHLLRPQLDTFIPISVSETYNLPVALNHAFAANEPGSHWAQPLLIDPMVMILKKEAIGITGTEIPKAWSDFSTTSAWYQQSNIALPHFVFFNHSTTSLSDTLASRILQIGYEEHSLQDTPQPRPAYSSEQYQVLANSLHQFNRFFQNDPDTLVEELPQVTSFAGFLNSNAFFTYARYSKFVSLPSDEKNQLIAYPIPYGDNSISPCSTISVAIPITAVNPAFTLDFVKYVENNSTTDFLEQNHRLAAFDLNHSSQLFEPFGAQAIFVLRESTRGINQLNLIDFLNGKIDLAEISVLWKRGFFIPEPVRTE